MSSYPWPRAMMLSMAEAAKVYRIEDQLSLLRDEQVVALGEHVERGKWTHVVPYMLFCTLEGYDTESSVAAALGYLRHVVEGDLQYDVVRESLQGLVLPKEKDDSE